MTNIAKEYPDFFRVFLTEKNTQRMLIPVAFVKLMQSKKRVIKDFILRDHRGRDWNVKARRIGEKIYFDDGWKKFKEENYLEENDFLFFTHVENNVFKFKIFELSSMCEKIKDEEENNNMMEGEDMDVSEDVDDDISDDDDDEDDDYATMVEEEEEDDDNDAEEEDEENDVTILKIDENKHQHSRNCKDWGIGSRSAVPRLKDDEIDPEMYIQPGNPYFIAKYMQSRPNQILIPKNIIKDFCMCFTKHITLVCCHCKDVQRDAIEVYHHILPQMTTKHIEQRADIHTWGDSRVSLTGWASFCRRSKIKESDTCLCEIVLREGEGEIIEMLRVHVVKKE